jgi:nucleotide-binding universal stress UspA family protein
MKVLIAVDDSEWSRAAIDFVQSIDWPENTQMVVLSAAAPAYASFTFDEMAYSPETIMPELLEQQRQYHEDIAKRCRAQLEKTGASIRAEVVTADPREAIVDLAKREGIELIVVGSHGRSGLKKLVMGSVSSYVVSHSPCSVLVVKLAGQK